MPSELPEDYFSTGHWAARGPLRLRTLTCLVCGTRLASWAAFRAHRRQCAGDAAADGAVVVETVAPVPVETVEVEPPAPPALAVETYLVADGPGPEVFQG